MNIRFIVQPVTAIILGIRDGIHDARGGQTPFLWDLYTRPERLKGHVKKALERLTIPLIVAIVLDGMCSTWFLSTYAASAPLL